MTKINQDIPQGGDERYIAGDTAVLNCTVEESDGSPKDLTGADVAFALAEYQGGTPIITKTTSDSDVVVTEPLSGKLKITINGEETEDLGDLGGEEYYYEIEARDSAGDTATVITGTWTIYPDTAHLL